MTECETIVTSQRTRVSITPSGPTVPVGERCNALGYKNVREALKRGEYSIFSKRAAAQEKAGARILNVNVVAEGVDEASALPRAIDAITSACSCPLSIDFANIEALESALALYKGRALINSINGEREKLAKVLRLMSTYKAAAIALLVDDDHGIPMQVDERLKIAEKILNAARPYGLGPADFIFDCVVLGSATEPQSAQVTFDTVRKLRQAFGCNITLGASNAAFGMPAREIFNAHFLCASILAGCNVPITDPTIPELKKALLAADVLRGTDEYAMNYIQACREEQQTETAKAGSL